MFTQLLSTYIYLNVTLRLTSIYLEWETGKEGQEKQSPSCLTQVNFAVIGGPRNQSLIVLETQPFNLCSIALSGRYNLSR